MKSSQIRMVFVVFISFVTLLFFQNCSEAEFSSVAGGNNKLNGSLEVDDEGGPINEGENPPPINEGEDPVVVVPPPENKPPKGIGGGYKGFACSLDNLKDVEINIDRIELGKSPVDENTFVGVKSLVQMSNGFVIIPEANASTNQIRLILKNDGNAIVNTSDEKFALKTPSAQQSGVKINLQGSQSFEAGKYYRITFGWDPAFQLVRAGKKCILKPVLRSATVTELEF